MSHFIDSLQTTLVTRSRCRNARRRAAWRHPVSSSPGWPKRYRRGSGAASVCHSKLWKCPRWLFQREFSSSVPEGSEEWSAAYRRPSAPGLVRLAIRARAWEGSNVAQPRCSSGEREYEFNRGARSAVTFFRGGLDCWRCIVTLGLVFAVPSGVGSGQRMAAPETMILPFS